VLYRDDEGVDHWIWTWAPSAPAGSHAAKSGKGAK
jgi:hypothetical protein